MAIVSRKYLPGYTGTSSLNGSEFPVMGWSSDHDPGLWDATSELSLGWMYQEAGLQKVSFTFTILCAVANGIPSFVSGMTIPVVFSINGAVAYQGNVIVTTFSTKCDIKGSVSFDCKADSQGPLTGNLVPAGLVVVPAVAPAVTPSS